MIEIHNNVIKITSKRCGLDLQMLALNQPVINTALF